MTKVGSGESKKKESREMSYFVCPSLSEYDVG